MDFWKYSAKKQFPDEKSLTAYYGACDTDGWLEKIRKNIRAALAEKRSILCSGMWRTVLWESMVAAVLLHTSKDVLQETAAIYNAFQKVPETVEILLKIFSGRGCAAFCLLK